MVEDEGGVRHSSSHILFFAAAQDPMEGDDLLLSLGDVQAPLDNKMAESGLQLIQVCERERERERKREREKERERERERKIELFIFPQQDLSKTERVTHCGKGTHRSYNVKLQLGQSVG